MPSSYATAASTLASLAAARLALAVCHLALPLWLLGATKQQLLPDFVTTERRPIMESREQLGKTDQRMVSRLKSEGSSRCAALKGGKLAGGGRTCPQTWTTNSPQC